MRRKLKGVDDGDRQMVDILVDVSADGLPAVAAACAEGVSPFRRCQPQHPRAPPRPCAAASASGVARAPSGP